MATLKEHQAAMVDLLANGSGIPASASRLAHAMHDLINVLYVAFPNLPQTKDEDWINGRETRVTITPDVTLDIKDIIRAVEANSPGLNDKALTKREKALKTDGQAKWPTPAEQRVKELENTIRQLKANNAKLKADIVELKQQVEHKDELLHTSAEKLSVLYKQTSERDLALSTYPGLKAIFEEQSGCRKPDTQECEHSSWEDKGCGIKSCCDCGALFS